jgi:hypothetical protein
MVPLNNSRSPTAPLSGVASLLLAWVCRMGTTRARETPGPSEMGCRQGLTASPRHSLILLLDIAAETAYSGTIGTDPALHLQTLPRTFSGSAQPSLGFASAPQTL